MVRRLPSSSRRTKVDDDRNRWTIQARVTRVTRLTKRFLNGTHESGALRQRTIRYSTAIVNRDKIVRLIGLLPGKKNYSTTDEKRRTSGQWEGQGILGDSAHPPEISSVFSKNINIPVLS